MLFALAFGAVASTLTLEFASVWRVPADVHTDDCTAVDCLDAGLPFPHQRTPTTCINNPSTPLRPCTTRMLHDHTFMQPTNSSPLTSSALSRDDRQGEQNRLTTQAFDAVSCQLILATVARLPPVSSICAQLRAPFVATRSALWLRLMISIKRKGRDRKSVV